MFSIVRFLSRSKILLLTITLKYIDNLYHRVSPFVILNISLNYLELYESILIKIAMILDVYDFASSIKGKYHFCSGCSLTAISYFWVNVWTIKEFSINLWNFFKGLSVLVFVLINRMLISLRVNTWKPFIQVP